MHTELRSRATADIDAAVTYYSDEAGRSTALDFIDALEAAIDDLRQHPLIGSLRFSYELEIPDLRGWPLGKFPYLVFYVPDDDRIDIWRVLHAQRDVPAYLATDPSE